MKRVCFQTVHILCSGGQGNYDARFPIRWKRPALARSQYGAVIRYCVYLPRGWNFVDQRQEHFGMLSGTSYPEKLYHYCVFKFLNETDDWLNPVTATNVHTIEANIERCGDVCCQTGPFFQ